MKKLMALTVALAFALLASGCNTVKGVGKDVQKAGEKIEDASAKTQTKK